MTTSTLNPIQSASRSPAISASFLRQTIALTLRESRPVPDTLGDTKSARLEYNRTVRSFAFRFGLTDEVESRLLCSV